MVAESTHAEFKCRYLNNDYSYNSEISFPITFPRNTLSVWAEKMVKKYLVKQKLHS